MKYCVNCGTPVKKEEGICSHCHADQQIPNDIVDAALGDLKSRSFQDYPLPFGYPGERGSLFLALIITGITTVVLATVSLGVLLGVLFLSLLHLRFSHYKAERNMVRVSETAFEGLDRLGKLAAYRLKMPLLPIYVTEDAQYNAYTVGFYQYGFIVVNSSLLKDFDAPELLFVIGHEMGHARKYHTTWLNLIGAAGTRKGKFWFASALQAIFNVWSVKAEYTADQAGLIACRDPRTCITTLLKLSGGSSTIEEVNIDKYYGRDDAPDRVMSGLLEYTGSHPFIENRIRQVIHFASSSSYNKAIACDLDWRHV